MLLSRGWCELLSFWAGVAAFCCVGATTLQVLGPPGPEEHSSSDPALDRIPTKPADFTTDAAPAGDAIGESAPKVSGETSSPQQSATASPIVVPLLDHDAAPDLQPEHSPAVAAAMTQPAAGNGASGGPQAAVAVQPSSDTVTVSQRNVPATETTVRLRIARDFNCPTIACYKWQLLSPGSKLPRHTMIDLAQLRFAPGEREAAETGQVELVVNALQRRQKINGRNSVILVAKSLDSVAPLRP